MGKTPLGKQFSVEYSKTMKNVTKGFGNLVGGGWFLMEKKTDDLESVRNTSSPRERKCLIGIN